MADPGEPLRVALVGCGVISGAYVDTLGGHPDVDLVAFADLQPDRAAAAAARVGGARAVTPEEAYAAGDVEVVLDLTVPAAHAAVREAALSAGRHVYGEKPLATGLDDGRRLVELAAERGLVLGCAPDTVLGSGVQTARAVLDRGDVGAPVAACAFVVGGGPEEFHGDPGFFYRPGGGPVLDMGPYHVTALVTLLGPVVRVSATAGERVARRPVRSGPTAGTVLDVAVDTHVSATLEHAGGAVSTLVLSWDAPAGGALPAMEVYGDAGTLAVPDPNTFDGQVRVRHRWDAPWTDVPALAGYRGQGRGIGLVDLAAARRAGTAPRASGALALHVLEVMLAVGDASRTRAAVEVTTPCERPAPVPLTDPPPP